VFALYDERFVTFGEDDVYEQSDAAGFIRLFALPARVRALKDAENAEGAALRAAGGFTGEFEVVPSAKAAAGHRTKGTARSLAGVEGD
jgi:hypothetical protein